MFMYRNTPSNIIMLRNMNAITEKYINLKIFSFVKNVVL